MQNIFLLLLHSDRLRVYTDGTQEYNMMLYRCEIVSIKEPIYFIFNCAKADMIIQSDIDT